MSSLLCSSVCVSVIVNFKTVCKVELEDVVWRNYFTAHLFFFQYEIVTFCAIAFMNVNGESAHVCVWKLFICVFMFSHINHWIRNVSTINPGPKFLVKRVWKLVDSGFVKIHVCLLFVIWKWLTCHSAIILLPTWSKHYTSHVRIHLVLGCANFKIFGLGTGDPQLIDFHFFFFQVRLVNNNTPTMQ